MHLPKIVLAFLATSTSYAAAKKQYEASVLSNSAYILNYLGMTISYFDNIDAAKASDEYSAAGPENPSFLLCNNHDTSVAVMGEINFHHGEGIRTKFLDPDFEGHSHLLIPAGKCILLGNIKSDLGDREYNGALRGYLGCDENGNACEGRLNVVTKVEFSTNVRGMAGIWGINLSLVDGYNGGIAMTAGSGAGTKSFTCHIPPQKLRASCPSANLIDGQFPSCMSDCRAFGDDYSCCTGPFEQHHVCKPTSHHLARLCGKNAYIWPHDDAKYTEVTIDKGMEVVFGPPKRGSKKAKKHN